MNNLFIFSDDGKTVIFDIADRNVDAMRKFGALSFSTMLNGYVLFVYKDTLQTAIDAVKAMQKPFTPQIKRRIAPYNFFQDACFCFYSSMEDAELLTEFGTVDRLSVADDKYAFLLNRQYDMQDILDYIDYINSES